MSKLIPFYTELMACAYLYADSDGMIRYEPPGQKPTPCMVGAKRLVLPTREHLSNPDKGSIVLFHPLQEHMTRGESEVLSRFRQLVVLVLNAKLGDLLSDLLLLAHESPRQQQFNTEQMELTTTCPTVPKKLLGLFDTLADKVLAAEPAQGFVHIFIKKGGKVKGVPHPRAAIVSFPVFEKLYAGEKTVLGVTFTNAERETLINLFKLVLPELEVPHKYDVGSQSDIGPSLDALMRGVGGVAMHLNEMVQRYGDLLPKKALIEYPDAWVEQLDNVAELQGEIRAIPLQSGNEGAPLPVAPAPPQSRLGVQPAAVQAPAPQPQAAQPLQTTSMMQQPPMQPPMMMQQPPAPAQTPRRASFGDLMKNQPAAPQMPQMPMQQPMMMPQQPGMMQPGMMAQPVTYQPGQIVNTPQGPAQVQLAPNGQLMLVPIPPQMMQQAPGWSPDTARAALANQQFMKVQAPAQMMPQPGMMMQPMMQPGMMMPGMAYPGMMPGMMMPQQAPMMGGAMPMGMGPLGVA